jgi:hypothetical protein
MVSEEKLRKRNGDYRQAQLGLMFIVPNSSVPTHWNDVNLSGPHIDSGYLAEIGAEQLDKKQRPSPELEKLLAEHREEFVSVLDRLRLTVVSWTAFRDSISRIESELDCSMQGDQTLKKLLAGLNAQINDHHNTGISRPSE